MHRSADDDVLDGVEDHGCHASVRGAGEMHLNALFGVAVARLELVFDSQTEPVSWLFSPM